MPIVDYIQKAKNEEDNFSNDDSISNLNKKYVDDFMSIYDVSPARKLLFLKHISILLRETDDISKTMHDRDAINKIFKKIRSELGDSYYSTVINVALRFTRWLNDKLNDDENKPKGFKDIKNLSKSKQKRQLNPGDMITWDDGLKLISKSFSIQIKGVLMTQLDGGFRPSEFIDLKYGDCERKNNFILVSIKHGKTGPRIVTLYKSVSFLWDWLQNHPTKKKSDPLWLQEKNTKGVPVAFNYPALQKRIRILGIKANIDKPLDFYNLRHSACVISKLDNVPEELAAEKFGHSIEYYTGTYGRLSTEDKMKRYGKIYGNKEEQEIKKQSVENIDCQVCKSINQPGSEFCHQCNAALTLGKALEVKQEKEKEIKDLKNQMDVMMEMIKNIEKEKIRAVITK